ncbi:hypothetical protein [Flavobacterium segetis]|uniref:hypothetical protein n=1 Tax=Flavobacterium segetis TaxID=271157 RepID=UPI0009FE4A83|nr:hypothetical protein [Flavobacterium segetis]
MNIMVFRAVKPCYDYDFLAIPQRQYIIFQDCEMEIEISKEGKRNFKGDDILLIENIDEKVHKTRNLVDIERSLVFRTI